MVNVNVIGRLGADAETLDGKRGKFVKFRVAVSDFKNGEKTTTWMGVLFSGERAEKIAQYLKKGSLISVHGTENVELYNDRNGAPQISREINASDVEFISVGKTQEGTNEAVPEVTTGKLAKPAATPTKVTVAASTVNDNDDVDDLPF